MMNSSATVSAELALALVLPDQETAPLVATLSYGAEDPFAIRMAFHVGTDELVEWTFARDLLAVGIEGAAGEGDVQLWPADEDGRELLNIVLSSPCGEAHFEAPRSSAAAFLRRTYEVIAPGHEADHIDVDGELDELLLRA